MLKKGSGSCRELATKTECGKDIKSEHRAGTRKKNKARELWKSKSDWLIGSGSHGPRPIPYEFFSSMSHCFPHTRHYK